MSTARDFNALIEGLENPLDALMEWRVSQEPHVRKAVEQLPTGTHLIDGHFDPKKRILTVLTEFGTSIELAWSKAADAIGVFLMVAQGEAEVVSASVSPHGGLELAITDGEQVVSDVFDPMEMNTLGFGF